MRLVIFGIDLARPRVLAYLAATIVAVVVLLILFAETVSDSSRAEALRGLYGAVLLYLVMSTVYIGIVKSQKASQNYHTADDADDDDRGIVSFADKAAGSATTGGRAPAYKLPYTPSVPTKLTKRVDNLLLKRRPTGSVPIIASRVPPVAATANQKKPMSSGVQISGRRLTPEEIDARQTQEARDAAWKLEQQRRELRDRNNSADMKRVLEERAREKKNAAAAAVAAAVAKVQDEPRLLAKTPQFMSLNSYDGANGEDVQNFYNPLYSAEQLGNKVISANTKPLFANGAGLFYENNQVYSNPLNSAKQAGNKVFSANTKPLFANNGAGLVQQQHVPADVDAFAPNNDDSTTQIFDTAPESIHNEHYDDDDEHYDDDDSASYGQV